VPAQGRRYTLPSVFVRGRHIRMIHLPESLDPERVIEERRKALSDAALHAQRHRRTRTAHVQRRDTPAPSWPARA
jgi:hypothetical protein